MKIQVFGLCRWSYLCPGGFQISHDDMDERRAYLYDPERLRRRWFWFRNVVLPGYLAQTDPDFTLLLMTGPDLPEPYMARLQNVARRVPQVRLELVEPMRRHRLACWTAAAPHIDRGADYVAHYRQDDDDAVAVDFVERVRADAPLLTPLLERYGRASLDYGRGLVVRAHERGIHSEERYIVNATAALLHVVRPTEEVTGVSFVHWKLAGEMPGLTIADRAMYLRLLHHDNDSGSVGAGFAIEGAGDAAETARDRFGVDLDRMRIGARRFGKPRGGARVGTDPPAAG